MGSIVSIYEEFIGGNLDKRYPLIDEDGNSEFRIPDSFLADLKLTIGMMDKPSEDSYTFNTYVSAIKVYPDYIYVEISIDGVGLVAKSDPIPTSLRLGDTVYSRQISIRPVGTTPVNGTLVIGTCEDIIKYPGAWTISKDHGLIFPANVQFMPSVITGIRVGDDYITGDIVLESDDNIDITYDESTNTIKFSLKNNLTEGPITIDDFLEMVSDKFGKPIITINGIKPDGNGNIQIDPTDCLMVTVDPSTSTISFYNPCGSTCASEEFMSDTYSRIADLNRNAAVLTSFYSSVSNVLAQMGVRVSSVLEPRQ